MSRFVVGGRCRAVASRACAAIRAFAGGSAAQVARARAARRKLRAP